MERRSFLRTGLLGGSALGASGCSATLDGLLQIPKEQGVSDEEVKAFLARLDGQLGAISAARPQDPMLIPSAALPTGDVERGRDLVQKTMRGLLITGSFADLPLEGRTHPAVQARMTAAMPELDDAMLGMRDFLGRLTPTERADLGRALRKDPDLGMRVVGSIDDQASELGVSLTRRVHMREIAAHACARLKQSSDLFLDDTLRKADKLAMRDTTPLAIERQLLAQLGEAEFFRMRDSLEAAAAKWNVATRDLGEGVLDPETRDYERQKNRANVVLTVGGVLLGVGLVHLAIGIPVLILGGGVTGGGLAGAFVITAGAVLGLAGIITMIVGGAIYPSR
ncbi:MAG: hypothetical protein U0271_01120 [Polyangiaceae bacterium]